MKAQATSQSFGKMTRMEHNCDVYWTWCVDAVLRLLGVFHDVLFGDVAPVRPVSTLGVVSVRLSRSLFVPGRHLKKGGGGGQVDYGPFRCDKF